MKLTLWQQFASNHSNGFTLVGVFADETKARETYTRLRKLLRDIEAWHEENGSDMYEAWSPSGPEKAIAKQFRFSWDDKSPDSPTDFTSGAIKQFRNIVQIDTPADSWARRTPYEILLRKSGATVAGHDSVDEDEESSPTQFLAKISCTLPTDEAAAAILKKWQRKLDAKGAALVKKGPQISISKLPFQLDLFSSIIKAFEKAGCTDVQYTLRRVAFDPEAE